MSPEDYKKQMAELGISRGGLEDGAEIESTPGGSVLEKERVLLNPKASTKVVPPPMKEGEIPEHLKCPDDHFTRTARRWWSNLSEEERAIQRATRARNREGGKHRAVG